MWQKFRTVYDESSSEEIFGYACCVTFKAFLLYKKLVDGTEKSMGMKNLLDHLNCVSSQSTYKSSASSSTETVGTPSIARMLDSFVKRSGKQVTNVTKDKIRERTATLVASAHLPYRLSKTLNLTGLLHHLLK